MSRFLDARIPVRFGQLDRLEPDAAWLIQGHAPAPVAAAIARFHLPVAQSGHVPDCRCCLPRGPVAQALAGLFLARVRGDVPFFRLVVALPTDAVGVNVIKLALTTDPVLLARFRLERQPG